MAPRVIRGNPSSARRAVQHAIGFAPGTIEEDEVGSHGASTPQEMLPACIRVRASSSGHST